MNNNINNDIINDSDISVMDFDYIINNNLIENKLLDLIENDNQDIYTISSKQWSFYLYRIGNLFSLNHQLLLDILLIIFILIANLKIIIICMILIKLIY